MTGRREPGELLTPREWQIARLVAAGFTDKEIAESLGNTLMTIRVRLARIYKRIGIGSRGNNRVLLARWVLRADGRLD